MNGTPATIRFQNAAPRAVAFSKRNEALSKASESTKNLHMGNDHKMSIAYDIKNAKCKSKKELITGRNGFGSRFVKWVKNADTMY